VNTKSPHIPTFFGDENTGEVNNLSRKITTVTFMRSDLLGLVYFSGIFIPEECEDMWEFGVHPILSNPLKYSSPKILYHDEEFLI
jgi:hypothetical protein